MLSFRSLNVLRGSGVWKRRVNTGLKLADTRRLENTYRFQFLRRRRDRCENNVRLFGLNFYADVFLVILSQCLYQIPKFRTDRRGGFCSFISGSGFAPSSVVVAFTGVARSPKGPSSRSKRGFKIFQMENLVFGIAQIGSALSVPVLHRPVSSCSQWPEYWPESFSGTSGRSWVARLGWNVVVAELAARLLAGLLLTSSVRCE